MRTVFRFILSVIALSLLAACSAPAPTPVPLPPPPPTQAVAAPTDTREPARRETRQVEPSPTTGAAAPANPPTPTTAPAAPAGSTQSTLLSDKIKHIVVIMQENRSFDTYFGTYPGADGIPMQNGVPTICSNDPQTKQCIKPYHNPEDVNSGGPHASSAATGDIDGGKMDGFVTQFRDAAKGCKGKNPDTPGCVEGKTPDVMGWHDAREIPNY